MKFWYLLWFWPLGTPLLVAVGTIIFPFWAILFGYLKAWKMKPSYNTILIITANHIIIIFSLTTVAVSYQRNWIIFISAPWACRSVNLASLCRIHLCNVSTGTLALEFIPSLASTGTLIPELVPSLNLCCSLTEGASLVACWTTSPLA